MLVPRHAETQRGSGVCGEAQANTGWTTKQVYPYHQLNPNSCPETAFKSSRIFGILTISVVKSLLNSGHCWAFLFSLASLPLTRFLLGSQHFHNAIDASLLRATFYSCSALALQSRLQLALLSC